jgi:hypothetical protein
MTTFRYTHDFRQNASSRDFVDINIWVAMKTSCHRASNEIVVAKSVFTVIYIHDEVGIVIFLGWMMYGWSEELILFVIKFRRTCFFCIYWCVWRSGISRNMLIFEKKYLRTIYWFYLINNNVRRRWPYHLSCLLSKEFLRCLCYPFGDKAWMVLMYTYVRIYIPPRWSNTSIKSIYVIFFNHQIKCTVNSTSEYTLSTFFSSYLKGVSANIELQAYSVTCCWPYIHFLEVLEYLQISVSEIRIYSFGIRVYFLIKTYLVMWHRANELVLIIIS